MALFPCNVGGGKALKSGTLTRVSGDKYAYSGVDEPLILAVFGRASSNHSYVYIDSGCYRDGAIMTYTLDTVNKTITFNGGNYITNPEHTYCYGY